MKDNFCMGKCPSDHWSNKTDIKINKLLINGPITIYKAKLLRKENIPSKGAYEFLVFRKKKQFIFT